MTGRRLGTGKNVSHTMDLVCQVYVLTSSDDSRVDGIMGAGSPSLSRLFKDGAMDSARDFYLLGELVPHV